MEDLGHMGFVLCSAPAIPTTARTMKDCNDGCTEERTGEAGSKEVMWTFKAKYLITTPTNILKKKPDQNTLVSGTVFMDYMLVVEWSSESD